MVRPMFQIQRVGGYASKRKNENEEKNQQR